MSSAYANTPNKFPTAWLYCVECPQYSIRIEAFFYVCAASLLRAFDAA